MDPASQPERPLDRLVDSFLDTFVYAPLGLVLLARDEVPKLAAQGRQRVEAQANVARMVGQLAVAQGRRQVRSVTERLTAPHTRPDGGPEDAILRRPEGAPAGPSPAGPPGRSVPVRDLEPEERLPVVVGETLPDVPGPTSLAPPPYAPPPPAGAEGAPPAPAPGEASTEPAPPTPRSAADLPIPGYDSLSASQVVQRLPGLSVEDLEAIRAYEQAGRARKTILLRVAQLRAAS